MKIYALFFALLASFYPHLALAQEVPRQTPREFIVNDIIQAQSPATKTTEETAKQPVEEPFEEPLEEPIPAPLTPQPTLLPEPLPVEVIEPPLEKIHTEEIIPEPVTIVLPEEILPQIEGVLPPQIAAFYLTTEEYLAIRGPSKGPQLVLTYDVSSQKKDMLLPVTTQILIILGNDYGAIKMTSAKGIEITKIYDFRLNRLLTTSVNRTQKKANVNLDNISLYAPIYRNIATVRRATQNGQLKTITLGDGQKLDAFWVESAMSWAANPYDAKLDIKEKKSSLVIRKDSKTIFKANFSKDGYRAENFQSTFLRLATHEWPLHPHVLETLSNYASPPDYIKMLSYNPGALEGESQTWTLVDRQDNKAKFPLPPTALSVSQRQPISPLVFIIGEAASGRAFDGPQTALEMEFDFKEAEKNEDTKALWLIGQRYNNYTGKCDQENKIRLCDHLSTFETTHSTEESTSPTDPKLVKFIQGVRLAKEGGEPVKILKILLPFLKEPDVPAIILQTAAMARAKINPSAIVTPAIQNLRAEKLLQNALAKDPYDPHIYLGLAQINAANEAYETSWDYYDALRSIGMSPDTLKIKIDTVEKKLRADAPMYFLQD